ncbi:carboxypeptidase-like regulatory domain-containing protein [Flavobacterium sp. DG1-102-2]|uniref:TonB-dependent receptor n=1 Tax=Flavobacterium sp. DG1-102-2 TaxID=3081663 RepID=UPI0029494B25|nr:carboxypeptidase-like regulatory domain-containing protein [Flavobacterium sp. DG1-102-2]MDV6168049.1 carboxypeptidase-like regulatory domain-containing protein [Flavobacterium sp. DG1-102-2]
MKPIITFLLLIMTAILQAQTKIEGTLTNSKGKYLAGANVYLDGTYDGASTDAQGFFSFETLEKGNQILVITLLFHEDIRQDIVIEDYKLQALVMKESVNTLDAVVISAGTFQAGDNSKVTALKPLDIVTTAGSAGDIVAALQTLPGTQTVGESGRLFVRGGESDETQTFVDGLRVAQPYGASANNLPARGRFSPFLFSGMTFSTGGYSAEYGEALSSVLLLNTIEEPAQEQTDISLMTVGLGLGNTQKWEKSSLSFNLSYINLQPYQWLVPQKVSWNKPYQSLSGETVYRYKLNNNGMLKVYAAFDHANFDLNQEDVNESKPVRVDMKNDNFYFNTSYRGMFGTQWTIQSGIAYGYSHNNIGLNQNIVTNGEHSSHLKLKLRKSFSERVKLTFGVDYFITDFTEKYKEPAGFQFNSGYNNSIGAVYAETDIFLSRQLAFKAGLRSSYASVLQQGTVEPRAALAYKVSGKSQFSLAYGDFYQTPKQDYLKYYKNFEHEKTAHYIFNYLYNIDGKMLRAEAYYKKYDNLVKYNGITAAYDSQYSNSGRGYAQGIDLLWRDNNTIKNLEYWVSYSYIDSKRDYRNYEHSVTPSYIARHNFSIVTKYWINSLRSQVGITHSFNSGRPYDNPNETAFMNRQTKCYNNLSMSWAWLMSPQKIVYISVSNVTGSSNVFGYTYANNPGADGQYARQAITQQASRFFFVGFFWTISDDKAKNQLDNL